MLNELDRQRYLNEVYTRETIILIKLLDLRNNIYHSNPKHQKYYLNHLDKIKPNLIKYERKQLKFKRKNNIF